MPTVDDAGDGRKAKRTRRAPAAPAAATQLRTRTAEEIATEQTVERLALRIWVMLVTQKILASTSAMLDALIDSHLFTDGDEEADEGWLDDRHKHERKIFDEAVSETFDVYPDFAAIADLSGNSDSNIAADVEQLKASLEKCAIGATKFRERFSSATLEQLIRRKVVSLLKEQPKYREHVREEVPGAGVKRYGDYGRTSTAGTFVKSAGYVDGGGLDTLLTGGWLRVAKDRIDPVALSHLHGFERNTERQCWQHHFQITARNEVSPFKLPRESLAGTGYAVERALMKAGVRVIQRKGSHRALARFMRFRPQREIVRMSKVGWAQVGKHWIFVRPDEVIVPLGQGLKLGGIANYELDAAAKQHGLHVAGTTAAWGAEIAAPLCGNSNVALALGTFFAAPLLCWADEPAGGNHFCGHSGIGKTMGAAIGQSIYGLPHELGDNTVGTTWAGSEAGFDAFALARSDIGIGLDEITLADRREAEQIVYKLASGTQGPRATSAGKLRETEHASVLVLSTGEKSLVDFIPDLQEGARKRLADIPAEVQADSAFETITSDQVDVVGKVMFNTMKRQHGAVGRDWQHHLVVLGPDEIKARLAQHREAFLALTAVRAVEAKAHPQVRTVVSRFALFAAALRMAIVAKLLPWTIEEADAGIVACMQRWAAQRGNTDIAGELVRAADQVLRDLVNGLSDRFIHIKKISGKWVPVSEADELRLRTVELFDGFAKPDFILIRPEAWKRYTNGFDPSVIAEQLKRRGVLIGSGSEMSKSEEVLGKSSRFYVLKRATLTA